ncbi:MAG: hypothetical protein BWY83_01164 [bacterium ADurb.Bin478]|nr:MAG: hypothetical protein BWY83_01164 [bacterium ADurb.Bin478]
MQRTLLQPFGDRLIHKQIVLRLDPGFKVVRQSVEQGGPAFALQGQKGEAKIRLQLDRAGC